jgi:hypothetical protein
VEEGRGGREIQRGRNEETLMTLHAEVWKDGETVCMAWHGMYVHSQYKCQHPSARLGHTASTCERNKKKRLVEQKNKQTDRQTEINNK